MGIGEKLGEIAGRQKALAGELESEYRALESNNLAKENAALKAQAQNLRAEIEKAAREAASLASENSGLKNALYEYVYNEKIAVAENTAKKLDIYLRAGTDEEIKRLAENEKLGEIVNRQKTLAGELEAEYRTLENSDLAKENAALKAQAQALRAEIEKALSDAAALATENSGLKNALYIRIFNEKTAIVENTSKKLDAYFRAEKDGGINRLEEIEKNVASRIKALKDTLADNAIDMEKEFEERLDGLSVLLDKKLTEARLMADQTSGPFSQEEREQLEAVKNGEISDEQIRAVAKKNNIERFVGLNILNVIGVLLLIAGAITAMRYTYLKLNDLFKGVMIFALGGIMLAAGEFLNRKKPNIFSLGISAGGIAILYVALAMSYFALHILGMYPAIAVCVLLTAGAFVLSNRYNSQLIAVFALVGGYLPIFSIGDDIVFVYGAMVYFAVLNLFALGISWNRKWRVTAFIGLALTIIGTAYICLFIGPGNFYQYSEAAALNAAVAIIYATFAFLIYTAIPIVSAYHTKTSFRKSDVILLAINTISSSIIIYGVLYRFELYDYDGLFAVAFAAFYLLLGRFIEKKFASEEPHIRALFYLTGLAFVVLIVPMQFGRAWLSLGWLAEGVSLAVYGILRNEKRFKQVGYIICILCLGAFFIFDIVFRDTLFVWKYLAITLGSLSILGAYMYKKMMSGTFILVYKFIALVNAWVYAIYIIWKQERALFAMFPGESVFQIVYLLSAASITATFCIAYAISRIKLLVSGETKVLSVILYIIGIIWLFVNNSANSPVASRYLRTITPNFGITVIGTLILAVLCLLSLFAVRDVMKIIVTQRNKGIEWMPLVISGYFVIVLTQNLIVQYNLSFSSAAISVIYVLAALAWIIYGFTRRFAFIRRFGLVLAIFAVIKLFLIDLASLTQGYRIISYFALGIALLAISFVYQYFSKRLELKEGTAIQKDNPS
ncbi:MAG: DUF2339 domain-containing protein [Treponema sp.]|jgi:uncharacterized membrane protein|nr:DUF2339 domain-containing protein [Treponema sp.]